MFYQVLSHVCSAISQLHGVGVWKASFSFYKGDNFMKLTETKSYFDRCCQDHIQIFQFKVLGFFTAQRPSVSLPQCCHVKWTSLYHTQVRIAPWQRLAFQTASILCFHAHMFILPWFTYSSSLFAISVHSFLPMYLMLCPTMH